jgi:transposase
LEQNQLFALALGLTEPWYVASVEFSAEDKRLEIGIDFRRGGTFPCPECGAAGCKAYDTEPREWRHLNFFEHQTILRARVPRVDCARCGVGPVNVPWSRPGSGFTLLFEALVLAMAAHMPVRAIARLVGEHDTRLWRTIHHYVDTARGQRDDSSVRNVGIDDKSVRRGHDYVTVFADLDERKVLFVADGRKGEVLEQFRWDLIEHGGDPKQVAEICVDMSAAYIAGVENSFPRAAITFDKFHVMKLLSEAIEKTRREEQKSTPDLKGHRFALLKNPENMRDDELEFASALLSRQSTMKTARAFHLRLSFQDFYTQPARAAKHFLRRWCSWASRSRVPEMVRVARTLRKHAAGVLRWFTSRITNGLLEAINSLIQSAKARARGFRTTQNLKAIIYLIAGKLDLQSTH